MILELGKYGMVSFMCICGILSIILIGRYVINQLKIWTTSFDR
jgi:hypothetical protein